MDFSLTSDVAGRKNLMVRNDLIITIYRRRAKKRYLKGKHTYEHERIYVPIPSTFHAIVKPFLNQRLKISITRQNDGLEIVLHPEKTFRHAERPPQKLLKNPTEK